VKSWKLSAHSLWEQTEHWVRGNLRQWSIKNFGAIWESCTANFGGEVEWTGERGGDLRAPVLPNLKVEAPPEFQRSRRTDVGLSVKNVCFHFFHFDGFLRLLSSCEIKLAINSCASTWSSNVYANE